MHTQLRRRPSSSGPVCGIIYAARKRSNAYLRRKRKTTVAATAAEEPTNDGKPRSANDRAENVLATHRPVHAAVETVVAVVAQDKVLVVAAKNERFTHPRTAKGRRAGQ